MNNKTTISHEIIKSLIVEIILIGLSSVIPCAYFAYTSGNVSEFYNQVAPFLTVPFMCYQMTALLVLYVLFALIRKYYRTNATNYACYVLGQAGSGFISIFRLLVGPFLFASGYEFYFNHNNQAIVLLAFTIIYIIVCVAVNLLLRNISLINQEKTI